MDETHPLPRWTIAGENVSVQNTTTLSPFIYTVNCCCCSFLPNIKSPPSAYCFGKLMNVVSFFPYPMTINEIPCLFSLLCSCVFSMLLLATLLFRHMRLIFKFAELSWVGAAPAHTLHLHCNSCPTLARGLSRDQLGGAVQFLLIENSLFGPRDVLLRKNSCSFWHCSNCPSSQWLVLGPIKMFLYKLWSCVSPFWWRLYLWWRNNLVTEKTVFCSITLPYCNSLPFHWMVFLLVKK